MVALALVVAASGAAFAQEVPARQAPPRHPYLVRALERLRDYDQLAFTAEVTATREIAATTVQVSGRVVVDRSAGAARVAVDATVVEGELETGLSFRRRGDGWLAVDHRRRVWTEGAHAQVLGVHAARALDLLLAGVGTAELPERLDERLVFLGSETFADEACHRFGLADAPRDEWSFAASDGLPRRVVERRWVGGAEHEILRWRLTSWTARPRFALDPFAAPELEGYRRVDPEPERHPTRVARPVHGLADGLAPLVEAMHASEARVLVVASVSPT